MAEEKDEEEEVPKVIGIGFSYNDWRLIASAMMEYGDRVDNKVLQDYCHHLASVMYQGVMYAVENKMTSKDGPVPISVKVPAGLREAADELIEQVEGKNKLN